jgi:hypothetical protein
MKAIISVKQQMPRTDKNVNNRSVAIRLAKVLNEKDDHKKIRDFYVKSD